MSMSMSIERAFTYQRPTEAQIGSITEIRTKALDLAKAIEEHCPPSADRTVAIRKVREAVMTANASIVLGPVPDGRNH